MVKVEDSDKKDVTSSGDVNENSDLSTTIGELWKSVNRYRAQLNS